MKNLKIVMLMCLMFFTAAASAVVVNVDFGTWNQNQVVPSGLYVGLGACPDAAANTFWNHAGRGWEGQLAGTNLRASDNVAITTIGFIFTDVTYDYGPAGTDYTAVPANLLLLADGRRPSDTAAPSEGITISGLTANTKYALFLYGGNRATGIGTVFTFNGVTGQTTGTMGADLVDGGNYVMLVVTSDATGNIVGTFAALPGQTDAAFNGFQITDVIPVTRGVAHTPVPENGDKQVNSQTTTTVSWYSPEQDKSGNFKDDPNIVSVGNYDVYFRTTEPNVLIDTPKSTNQAGQSWTITPALAYNTTYYWRVDTRVTWDSNSFTGTASTTGIMKGTEWQFKTKSFYIAPTVTFSNVRTALPLLPATLSATFTGNTRPITSVAFTLLDGDYEFPAGAIASVTNTTTNLQTPTATLTTDKAGKYKVKLVISDDDGVSVDKTTVEKIAEVMVYVDTCTARKSTNVPSAWAANTYDRDGDCLVDLATGDLSDFVQQWLNDNSMKAQASYVKDASVLVLDIKVECENAYAPTDPNYTTEAPLEENAGAPRIESDGAASGGKLIRGFNTIGSLLTYQVVVPTAGAYTLYVRSYHEFTRALSFDLITAVSPDGNPANDTKTNLTTISLPSPGAGAAWYLDSKTPVTLAAGTNLIRVTKTDQWDADLDFFGFKKN